MRQHIDLAILPLANHNTWFETFLLDAAPALSRVKVHKLECPDAGQATDSHYLSINYLAHNAIALKRYDACLIPVSFDTLGWTRQALASIPRGPFIPLVGVFSHLKAASMQDLMELGLADFVRVPLCTEEFRARLLSAITRMPRSTSLRETDGQASYQVQSIKPVREPRRLTAKNLRALGFKEAKQTMIDQFERKYLIDTLSTHDGNIAMAARAARKHRRAYWELMRKHGIEAEPYKPALLDY